MKSTRERILGLLGRPITAQVLAKRLDLSVPTVAYHLARIREEGPAVCFSKVREGKRGLESRAWFLFGGAR